MVNTKLRESLDADFCQKALNAVRVAALRDGKNNEQILVHLTLSRGEGYFAVDHFSQFSIIAYRFIRIILRQYWIPHVKYLKRKREKSR